MFARNAGLVAPAAGSRACGLRGNSSEGRVVTAIGELTYEIQDYVIGRIEPRTRGMAAFARTGRDLFWLALQFEVPLPTWITIGSTPNIYHLVELKDNYDRYVVLLTTEASARIMSVNLRLITSQLWQSRPELRRHAGHDRSRDHF